MRNRIAMALAGAISVCGCGQRPASVGTEAAAPAAAAATERIVYSSLRPGNWDVYYFAAPNAAPVALTADSPGLDYDAAISPDGRWVVFTSERRGNPDLYAVDVEAVRNGAAPAARLLIDSPALEDQAAFSADGRTLAFVSTASGNADVFTSAVPAGVDATPRRRPEPHARPGRRLPPRLLARRLEDRVLLGPRHSRLRTPDLQLHAPARGRALRDGQRRQRRSPAHDAAQTGTARPSGPRTARRSTSIPARPRELPGPPTSPILGQEGGFRIWAIAADGTNPRAVTPPGVEALAPAVMPNGRIAYQTRSGFADWSIQSIAPDGDDAAQRDRSRRQVLAA